MAPLGKTSLSRLEGVKTQTARRAGLLADYATAIGGDIGIAAEGGLRSTEKQRQLYADSLNADGTQKYRVAPPGKSRHESGDAFDIRVLVPASGKTVDETYAVLGAYAPTIGLRWGGTFKGGAEKGGADPFHFENAVIEPDESGAGVDDSEPADEPELMTLTVVLSVLFILGALLLPRRR